METIVYSTIKCKYYSIQHMMYVPYYNIPTTYTEVVEYENQNVIVLEV